MVSLLPVFRSALPPRFPIGVFASLLVLGLAIVSGAQDTSPIRDAQTNSGRKPTGVSQPAQAQPDGEEGTRGQAATASDTAGKTHSENTTTPNSAGPSITSRAIVADSESPELRGHGTVKAKYDVSLIGQRNVGTGINFYSLDREIALGRQLSLEVEHSTRLITDPVVTEYVNRIGQNLVRNSDARVPFIIKVVDSEEVNAFALPGGFFYVNSGLILATEDEAELAGVMAHEIAHVAARHATKNMTRAQIWNMAQIPLMVVGGPVAYAISEAAALAVPLGFLKFSRDAEREADLLGLEYDYAAGYDPHAFVDFFEKLGADEKKKHSAIAKAFSTHPMNSDRIKSAQEEISKYLPDRPEYVVNTSEFDTVKAHLLSLDNAGHIGGPQDIRRPILMRRTGSLDTDTAIDPQAEDQHGAGSPSSPDKDRPVLMRAPQNSKPNDSGNREDGGIQPQNDSTASPR